jgi:hypothetical protein
MKKQNIERKIKADANERRNAPSNICLVLPFLKFLAGALLPFVCSLVNPAHSKFNR